MDYNNPSGPYELDADLKSSTTSGASLPLIINITDSSNNTGELIAYINTASDTAPPGGGGGSSSSSGSSSGMNIPPTASQENKTPISNFDYEIENSERIFYSGFQNTVMATITNNGDLPLLIQTQTSQSPINITLDDKSLRDLLSPYLDDLSEGVSR